MAGTLFLLGGVPDPASILSGDFNLEALLAIIGGQAQRFRARRLALDHRMLVTPTLIRVRPLPRVTILGNLSDTAKVVAALRRGGGER